MCGALFGILLTGCGGEKEKKSRTYQKVSGTAGDAGKGAGYAGR